MKIIKFIAEVTSKWKISYKALLILFLFYLIELTYNISSPLIGLSVVIALAFIISQVLSYSSINLDSYTDAVNLQNYREVFTRYRKQKSERLAPLLIVMLLVLYIIMTYLKKSEPTSASLIDLFLATGFIFFIMYFVQVKWHNSFTTFVTMISTSLIGGLMLLISSLYLLAIMLFTLSNFLGNSASMEIPNFPFLEIGLLMSYDRLFIFVITIISFIYQIILVKTYPPFAIGSLKKSLKLMALMIMIYSSILYIVESDSLGLKNQIEQLISSSEYLQDDQDLSDIRDNSSSADVLNGLKSIIIPYSSGLILMYFYLENLSSKYNSKADSHLVDMLKCEVKDIDSKLVSKILWYGGDSYLKYIEIKISMNTSSNTISEQGSKY